MLNNIFPYSVTAFIGASIGFFSSYILFEERILYLENTNTPIAIIDPLYIQLDKTELDQKEVRDQIKQVTNSLKEQGIITLWGGDVIDAPERMYLNNEAIGLK
ncbi:hypothetical protein A3715_17180 [Oleiphilus sp. HI0009]|nr:hypothetical protein A3715_17180 [Oleiphilus sp. HI0009]